MPTLLNATAKVKQLQKFVLNPVTMQFTRYKFQIIFTIGLLLSQLAAIAQGTVSGPASTAINNTYQYSYTNFYTSAQWTVTKGTVISSWLSPDRTIAYANIKWTSLGTGTITLRKNNLSTIIATKSVSITCGTLYTPTAVAWRNGSEQTSSACLSAYFRIDATVGTNGQSVNWYYTSDDPEPFLNGSSWYTPTLSSTTTYYISTYYSVGCESSRVPVTLTINPLPVAYTVSGGGTSCGVGLSVTLSGSDDGVNYQLKINGSNSGSAVAGTSGPLTWNNQTTNGTYTVEATHMYTGCMQTMSGSASVTVNAIPAVYTVGGGGSYCSGGSGLNVTLSSSQGGVNYQLKLNGSNSGAAVAGTGGSLTWNNQTGGGTYTVEATNASTGCAQTMSGSASVSINALPTVYTAGGGGSYCSGGSGVSVTLSGSQSGVNYQLRINGTISGSAVAGTGGVLTWSNQTASGTYTFEATNATTGCFQEMSGSASVTINALPTAYTVSGGGSYCSGGSGVSVTLSGSQGGVNYQLKLNGSNSGAAVAGTGGSLTWNNQTGGGTYTVEATNASTACAQTMSGSASVTINALPIVYTVGGGGSYCSGGSGLSVTLSGSQSGVNYQLKINGSNSGSAVAGTGSSLAWNNQTSSGTYTVVATNASTGCAQTMSGSASVTVNALPTAYTVAGGGSYCSGGSGVSVTLSGSQSGVNYQLKINGSNSGSAVAGTGSLLTWANQTSSGTYTIAATNSTTGCVQTMSGSATVTINPTPAAPAAVDLYSTFAYGHGQITVGSEFANTRWYNVSTGGSILIEGPSYLTPDISAPTPYYASNFDATTGCEGPRTAIVANIKPLISLGSLKTEIIRTENITQDSQIGPLTGSQKSTAISHFDGLLRTVQQSVVKGSPLGKDIVQPIEYDPFGRTAKQYLPYVATTTDGSFQSNYKTAQPAFYNAADDKIANDTQPYAQSVYEASPLGRPLEGGSIGQDFQPGSGHTVRASYSFNTGATSSEAEEVRKFNSDGSSTGFYGVNTLYRSSALDENGNTVVSFADGTGKTIVKKQQLDEIIDGATVAYLQTYYIYDDFGRIKYIVSPKGVAALRTNGWNLTSILDQYVYQFVYDSRGRVIEKKVPGQAWMYYIYDKLNRIVLVQDGLLRPNNKWFYIKYDNLGRPVMQGIYLNATQTTRATIQTLVDGLYVSGNGDYPENTWYESRNAAFHGYNNVSFPKVNADNTPTEVWSVNYYDHYDFDFNGIDDYSYTAQSLPGEPSQPQGKADGMPTGGKKLVLGTSTWLYDYVFYDRYGRAIQMRSNNHLSSAIDNLVTNVYDFEGKALKTKNYHNGGAGRITTVINTYEYDTQGRLLKVSQSNNGGTDQLVAQYEFNELGQLVDKKLHYTGGSNFQQSVDYRYNIRGQLLSINNGQLAVDNSNDDTNDYFGMELLYNTAESGLGNTQYFNGNISAMKWKGPGTTSGAADQRSYKYTYDKANRLETATSQMNSGSLWNKEVGVSNESMNYDHNGNILSLQRNQRQHQLSGVTASYTSQQIDNLTYTYDNATGDQLKNVEDAAAQIAGFNNGATQTTEYSYDVNGNVTEDKNKGISSISYNHLGKPTVINFTDGRKIEYTYDATGSKLTMKGYQGSTLLNTTDYVGSFVYENGTLNFFGSPEGRIFNKGGNLEYEYAIADHQGNTRVVFTSATPAPVAPLATFEGDNGDGASQYQNVDATKVVTFISANHTPSGSKVVRLNQTYKTGPSKSLKVYPGDKVDMETWAYYEGSSGWGNTSTGISAFITNVAAAFGGVSGGGGESSAIYSGVNSAIGAAGMAGNQGDTRPSAYLNYILFDKDYKMLDMGWQVVPTTANMAKQQMSIPTVNIKEAGYIFVYLSYEAESNNWMYFDDFKVTHTKTNIIQYNEYYPFGLASSTSWTRENNKNDFLYNAGSELNQTSGWYDLPFRNYDAALGRFMQVDPMSVSEQATYQYAGNNPVYFNDPLGALKYDNSHAGFMAKMENSASMSGFSIEWAEDGGYAGGGTSARNGRDYERKKAEVELLTAARTGDPNAVMEYGRIYGQEYEAWDYYTNGIVDEDHYIDTEWRPGQQGGSLPIPGERTWYTGFHSGDFDIVREHQIKHTNFGYTEITRAVTITYGEGKKHKIEKYGYQTKSYYEYGTQEQSDNSPYINTVLGPNVEIQPKFWDQIYMAVNNHLSCDCYTNWFYQKPNRLNAGSGVHR